MVKHKNILPKKYNVSVVSSSWSLEAQSGSGENLGTVSILPNLIMIAAYKKTTKLLNFPHTLKCNNDNCSFPHCARVKKFIHFTNKFAKLLKILKIKEKSKIIYILNRMIIEEKKTRLKQYRIKEQKKTHSGHLHYMLQHIIQCDSECFIPFCSNFKRNK